MSEHRPVLLHETLEALAVRPDGCYVDATFGRGGHSAEILSRLGDDGKLLVADRDPAAIDCANRLYGEDSRVTIVHNSFSNLAEFVDEHGIAGKIDGLLLDLGISSPQIDQAERGFSFSHDGPLDMRMDTTRGESAAQWLARVEERDLNHVIRRYGEERRSRRVAHAIVTAREETPITGTAQLAAIIAQALPPRDGKRHPATKVFQAIRIHINNELGELETVLDNCLDVMAAGGRLCLISFHSLEDRMVKRFLRRHSLADPMWRGLPDIPAHAQPRLARPARATRAGEAEVAANPRSRSAVLRSAEVLQ